MTQEEKQLLLIDLCARLLYKPKVKILSFWNENKEIEEDIIDTVYCVMPDGYINTETIDSDISLDNIKPYLRPISSMTKEETKELWELLKKPGMTTDVKRLDWLNSHHFDYRGLIEKELALKAPESMYNINIE